ncbi:LamG-like jellyroll fold domain-containing protein [Mariniflexile sp.]|uniref:LamG-like jellyroll fold domain-containing protein n=1 Tax=Mariniflexile sp. TaxID=1979402 RepID=UPI003568A010
MKKNASFSFCRLILLFGFVLISFGSKAQVLKIEVLGGAVVNQGDVVVINAGSSLTFRATNVETGNCGNLQINEIAINNTTDFGISPNKPSDKLKPYGCKGENYLDFEIENLNTSCTSVNTLVTIDIKNGTNFSFTLEVNSSPEIFVLGGSPWADILHNETMTSDTNGTYYGQVEEGASITRYFLVTNVGNCDLTVSALSSSNSDFTVFSSSAIPISFSSNITIGVTFVAPASGSGTQRSTISIANTGNGTFNFDVSAEMFNYNIPGPGGITANFRLWLKTTRGISHSASKVSLWEDLGTNGKDAEQLVSANQPTYLDNVADNINFNPVIKFENNGSTIEQFLGNDTNGFYSQDVFVVMKPNTTVSTTTARSTIFAGIDSGAAGDVTGIGFGDYSSEFTNETLSYNQDVPGSASYNGTAQINTPYSKAGIINVRNDSFSSPTAQDILYNSSQLATSTTGNSFANVNGGAGSKYWIGRNYDAQGSLNGSVAEIFTFGDRVTESNRQKIESYLAIKYGITLGASNQADKDYINSFNTKVWDVTANAGYNYDIAGIGRDSISDLNQKQSKTLNSNIGITIGLGGVFSKNSANPNEFEDDGDFLVWGNNNGAYSGSNMVSVDLGFGTTSITRMNRKWKIVESTEVGDGDVETVYIGIPTTAFSSFSKTADEEYVLIVSNSDSFNATEIIDVIPLKINVDQTGTPILDSNNSEVYVTWYDFHDTKYFSFGKTQRVTGKRGVSIGLNDFMVGESFMNLNANSFTVSAWVKSASNNSLRTIIAKGDKLQMRLNTIDQVEVYMDNNGSARITSTMLINDGKWHQITTVYKSGTLFLYIDGLLDKSEQNIEPPTPNFNHLSIGAFYLNKQTVTNPLLGDIDEVYVWNRALSENQVRYLMNQEIEKVSGDLVCGKVIPEATSSSEVATIPWSELSAYYDFNSIFGSTVEGQTDERNFLRLNYLEEDKAIVNIQTTPTPYVSVANGSWDSASTWSNSANQVIPNSVGLNGTNVNWNIVQLSDEITSEDRDISLLGLIQTGGTLTMADPNETFDETNSGQSLTISHYLELDGVIDLIGESQFIQNEGCVLDADSGGYIERDQQGTANGFNYNYWSSSVGPISGDVLTRGVGVSSTNGNHTLENVLKDGSISGLYDDLIFSTNPNGSGTAPPPGFAKTISTTWTYKFYGAADNYWAWSKINESSPLMAGEGFTMKGTSGEVSIATKQNYVFRGLPNNGDITLALDKIAGTGDVERLIGNPYPSAIDANEFILDNISVAEGGTNTQTVINGALYFWDHFGEQNSHVLKEYVGGYATYNLTGGAPAISNDSRINTTSDNGSAATGTKVPGQYVPVNQGFFVSTKLEVNPNDNSGTISSVDGGNVIFKNSQRVYATEDGSTSLFFKNANSKVGSKTSEVSKNQKPLIRLLYNSPLGYHRQIVIGANEKASNGFDLGYDAYMADVNKEDMYWIINNDEFVIQGVGNFNASQEFPIGLIVNKAGLVSIALDSLEGLPTSTTLYIEDAETNSTYRINDDPFEVNLATGVYNDRFKIVFQPKENYLLSQTQLLDETKDLIVYYNDNSSELEIRNTENIVVLNLGIYNMAGQQVKSLLVDDNASSISIPLTLKSGAYILKLNTDEGLLNKKIIIN